MKKMYFNITMVLFVILAACSKEKSDRNNPFDPDGTSYQIPTNTTLSVSDNTISFGDNYTIRWPAAERTTSYSLQESLVRSFSDPKTYNVTGTSKELHHEVSTQTVYYYRVCGMNGKFSGKWSDIVSITVVPIPAPSVSVPEDRQVNGSEYNISWNTPTDAESFILEESVTDDFAEVKTYFTEDTTLSFDHEVNALTTYFYRVCGKHGEYTGNWSNTTEVEVLPPKPVTPGILRTIDEEYYLVLEWDAAQYASEYYIEVSEYGDFSDARTKKTSDTTTKIHYSGDQEAVLHFRVKSVNATDVSDWSQPISATVNPFSEYTDISFVSIPGGTFRMGDVENTGDTRALPVHTVTISSFEMSIHEITNEQYARYLTEALIAGDIELRENIDSRFRDVYGKTGKYRGKLFLDLGESYEYSNTCRISITNGAFTVTREKERWPVVSVTWYGAKAFAEHYGLDLPREAEWEYASRYGNHQYMYGTDDGKIDEFSGNYNLNNYHPVNVIGWYHPNPFGLYCMIGNVSEWCADLLGDYSSQDQIDPTGPELGDFPEYGEYRIKRGGFYSGDAGLCRSAWRGNGKPESGGGITGFRVVRR